MIELSGNDIAAIACLLVWAIGWAAFAMCIYLLHKQKKEEWERKEVERRKTEDA